MPGLRARPAVTITTSEPRMSDQSFAPRMWQSTPRTGVPSMMSSALPWGMPSTMSIRTISPIAISLR